MTRPRPIGVRAVGVAAVPAKYERGGRGSSGAGGRASSSGRRSGAGASAARGELEPPSGRCWNSWTAGRRPPGEWSQVSFACAEGKGGCGGRPVRAEEAVGGGRASRSRAASARCVRSVR